MGDPGDEPDLDPEEEPDEEPEEEVNGEGSGEPPSGGVGIRFSLTRVPTGRRLAVRETTPEIQQAKVDEAMERF